jgi:hypothetical protein
MPHRCQEQSSVIELRTDDKEGEFAMTALANSLPVTSQVLVPTDEQAKQSLGARLIRSFVAAQERRADREIRRFWSRHQDSYRSDFGFELERRMLGQ